MMTPSFNPPLFSLSNALANEVTKSDLRNDPAVSAGYRNIPVWKAIQVYASATVANSHLTTGISTQKRPQPPVQWNVRP